MVSKNKVGRGNVHYTGKKKYKYVHYIRYLIRKCLRLYLHINGSRARELYQILITIRWHYSTALYANFLSL